MKATRWYGTHDVRVEDVPDPSIQDARDAIIRITSTAICGSDLHIYDGYIPTMEEGDILGHEFMGVVEEVGKPNGLKKGATSSFRSRSHVGNASTASARRRRSATEAIMKAWRRWRSSTDRQRRVVWV